MDLIYLSHRLHCTVLYCTVPFPLPTTPRNLDERKYATLSIPRPQKIYPSPLLSRDLARLPYIPYPSINPKITIPIPSPSRGTFQSTSPSQRHIKETFLTFSIQSIHNPTTTQTSLHPSQPPKKRLIFFPQEVQNPHTCTTLFSSKT